MLKIATEEDYDLVVKMGMKFIDSTPYAPYKDEEKIRNIVLDFIHSPKEEKIILLHGEEGMLAGMVNPFLFGYRLTAAEVAWWVDPEARGKKVGQELIEAFEYWAKQVGCSLITMASLDDKVGKYYESRGYKLCERAYIKEL